MAPRTQDLASGGDSSGASAEDETVVVAEGTDASPPLAAPMRLGRYVVMEQVGAGGMGRVFRAYDPKLRREVALKLLTVGSGESEGVARIVREAQAMARLSHPNLVPVYDVEQDEDAATSSRPVAFIAMEYVEGETLKTWLSKARRSWREVLAAFVDAGRGLAAAHAAGVVHRDFKPSNVMVGQRSFGLDADGRPQGAVMNVRVMDFGLARGIVASDASSSDDLHSDAAVDLVASADDLDPEAAALSRLTQAGTIVGTPPYMAPEQHCGADVIPASDQYAFCVAFHEALFGVRPFVGDDLASLVCAKSRGVPATPAVAARRVPKWLRAAVVRGLAVEPADRWPSMAALVDVLERGQARARTRRVLTGLGAFGIACGGLALAYQLDVRKRTQACEHQGASIGEVWSVDARARLHDALLATEVSFAGSTAQRVMPWLDAQAEAWQRARTEACLDESVREVWNADVLDRSLWCLDERRMQLEALVEQLSNADATSIRSAVSSAAGLSSVDACRDSALLERLSAPPTERREDVRAVRAELSRADALGLAGKSAEGLELARAARERADALGWPPLSATARGCEATLLELRGAYDEAERLDTLAYYEAARIGAWDAAANAATRLVFVVGSRSARPAEGLAWGEHSAVALAHAGDPSGLREATRLHNLASIHHNVGEYPQARTLHERSIALREQALGPDHPGLAAALNGLAGVHHALGDDAQARTVLERALGLVERALGPDHPDVAGMLGNLATLHFVAGEYDEARALLERAITITETAFGPDHPGVANNTNTLALVVHASGENEEAKTLHERVLAMRERRLGPDHSDVATSLNNLASVHRSMGEDSRAQPLYERALAIWETTLGPDHPNVAACLNNLADIHRSTGAHEQAGPLYERALAIREKTLGARHPGVALSLVGLGELRRASGDHEGAVPLLDRAVAIYDEHEGRQDGEFDARFALAEALVASGGDRARARVLAEQARDGWRAAARPNAKRIAEVERWLAAQ